MGPRGPRRPHRAQVPKSDTSSTDPGEGVAACEEAAGSGTVTAEDSGGVEAEAEAWRRWLRLLAMSNNVELLSGGGETPP